MDIGKGMCGCGEINFDFDSSQAGVINCHCQMCRSHNGAAFTSYAIVPDKQFELSDPNNHLRSYQKDGSEKYFCGACGTPLFNTHQDYPSIRLVYLGSIRQPENLTPASNVWCENQLDWVKALNNIPAFPQSVGS